MDSFRSPTPLVILINSDSSMEQVNIPSLPTPALTLDNTGSSNTLDPKGLGYSVNIESTQLRPARLISNSRSTPVLSVLSQNLGRSSTITNLNYMRSVTLNSIASSPLPSGPTSWVKSSHGRLPRTGMHPTF
jgi:hypothetical protein